MCAVCLGMFALPLGVIRRLRFVIVALSGHLLYHIVGSVLIPILKCLIVLIKIEYIRL